MNCNRKRRQISTRETSGLKLTWRNMPEIAAGLLIVRQNRIQKMILAPVQGKTALISRGKLEENCSRKSSNSMLPPAFPTRTVWGWNRFWEAAIHPSLWSSCTILLAIYCPTNMQVNDGMESEVNGVRHATHTTPLLGRHLAAYPEGTGMKPR